MRIITGGPGSALDPAIVAAFRKVVGRYPVGTEVALPDGRTGVVAAVDLGRPEEPVVRIGAEDVRIDLRTAAA